MAKIQYQENQAQAALEQFHIHHQMKNIKEQHLQKAA